MNNIIKIQLLVFSALAAAANAAVGQPSHTLAMAHQEQNPINGFEVSVLPAPTGRNGKEVVGEVMARLSVDADGKVADVSWSGDKRLVKLAKQQSFSDVEPKKQCRADKNSEGQYITVCRNVPFYMERLFVFPNKKANTATAATPAGSSSTQPTLLFP